MPLVRPRSYDMASSAEFGEIYGEVLQSIGEQSLRVAEFGAAVA